MESAKFDEVHPFTIRKGMDTSNEMGLVHPNEHETLDEEFLSIDYVPAFQIFPSSRESQVIYVLLKVGLGKDRRSAPRTPLNIALVLDQSSSMRGEKLYALKAAARRLVDELTPGDYFSLVSFNDRATVVVGCQKVTSKETIKQHIDSIDARGGTELANGLYTGITEMKAATDHTSLNFLLLLTDGQTYGDAERCIQLGQEASRQKITIHAMGVGIDWNEDLLDTVVNQCGGNTEYIASADKIMSVFLKKIKDLRGTVTPASNLRFELAPQFRLKQVHRVSPLIAELPALAITDDAVEYNLGQLALHTRYTLLLEMVVSNTVPGILPVGNVRLAFQPAGTENPNVQIKMALGLSFSDNTAGITIDPEVRTLIEKVTAFRLQAKAWQDIAQGDIKSGTQRLTAVSTRLLNIGEKELANQVLQEIRNLEQRGTVSSGGRKRIKYGTRGLATESE
jgi:uncharacterized protein YegL